MKREIIAATASVVLAGTPFLSVFAASCGTYTDNVNINVEEVCAFTRTVGNGTYSFEMGVGTTNNNAGTTTFKVVCNNAAGYNVRADFTPFVDQRATGTKGTNIAYAAAAPSTTAGAATWTAVLGGSSSTSYIVPSTESSPTNVLSKNTVTSSSGDTQQITYKVATATNQAAGTYQATATYTVTQL